MNKEILLIILCLPLFIFSQTSADIVGEWQGQVYRNNSTPIDVEVNFLSNGTHTDNSNTLKSYYYDSTAWSFNQSTGVFDFSWVYTVYNSTANWTSVNYDLVNYDASTGFLSFLKGTNPKTGGTGVLFELTRTTLSVENNVINNKDIGLFYNTQTQNIQLFNDKQHDLSKVIMYNSLGQVCKEVKIINQNSGNEIVNVSNLKRGVYFFNILLKTGEVIKKQIVL